MLHFTDEQLAYFRKILSNGQNWALDEVNAQIHDYESREKQGLKITDDLVDQLYLELMPDIVEWFKTASKDDITGTLDSVMGLHEHYDLKGLMPFIAQIIKKDKTQYVKNLLLKIKKFPKSPLNKRALDTMKELGINWPELDVIRRGMVSKSKINENNNDKINYYKKLLKSQGGLWAVDDIFDDMTDRGLTQDQIASTFKTMTPDIVEWFDNSMAKDYLMGNVLDTIIDVVSDYDMDDIIPNIREILNKDKKAILQWLLSIIKENPHEVHGHIGTMNFFGVTWPELKILEKRTEQQNP